VLYFSYPCNRWVERALSLRHTCRIRGRLTFPVLVGAVACLFEGERPALSWITQHESLPFPSPHDWDCRDGGEGRAVGCLPGTGRIGRPRQTSGADGGERGTGAGGGEQLKQYPPEASPAVISPQQTEGVGYVELIARASHVALGRGAAMLHGQFWGCLDPSFSPALGRMPVP
jgi:hypothetical protein